MERIITCPLGEDLIETLSDFIVKNFEDSNHDFSKIMCVFGGRRPALFLRRALAKKIKKPFYPPRVLTIDEFIEYVATNASPCKKIGDLEASYLIYQLAKKVAPRILSGRENFSDFLPWAREIHSFIEQLDLEDIADSRLTNIEKSAAIGYDVPSSINALLEHIVKIRSAYHKILDDKETYSRGRLYRKASQLIGENKFDDFDAIIFANFFYLHATELAVIKAIYQNGKGVCVFQGSDRDWSVLNKNAQALGVSITPQERNIPHPHISLYQGFDMHAQVGIVRHILEKIDNKESTVIVLPRPQALIVLLSEIASVVDDFNVSMGYPLKRSSLYELCNAVLKAQNSRKAGKYYARDYLNLLRHPLIKNLSIAPEGSLTRVIVHKIEELLRGEEESSIGGSLFISLSEIESEEKIYTLTIQTLQNMGVSAEEEECKEVLRLLHQMLFKAWEENNTFRRFCETLGELLNLLITKSMLTNFPFNLKIIEKLQEIKEELENLSFNEEIFQPYEIWEIFQQKLEREAISFVGTPLKGLQILGLFETRALKFENVIVMDMNESVCPKLQIYEPLIPREVMLTLGLNRLEKEEEIQRYQFHSLIAAAKNVSLIYEASQEKEKSRFIEEILWRMQKEKKVIDVIKIPKAAFSMNVISKERIIAKTPAMINFMKSERYSASRINTYLNCPLQFYYEYVLGIEEKEDLLDEPEASCIGSFIHELLEDTFSKFRGRKPVIDARFEKYFFKTMDEKFKTDLARRMKSDSFLLKHIIRKRLERFLENELKRDVAKIICLEDRREDSIIIGANSLRFAYTVDRIDEFNDKSIMIIDYKTGGSDIAPKRYSALANMDMDLESIRENIKSFQLPLYYYFVAKEFPERMVNAELYSLRTLERRAFICEADSVHKNEMMAICLKALEVVFNEIFDPAVAFVPKKDERRCEYCSFSALCG